MFDSYMRCRTWTTIPQGYKQKAGIISKLSNDIVVDENLSQFIDFFYYATEISFLCLAPNGHQICLNYFASIFPAK